MFYPTAPSLPSAAGTGMSMRLRPRNWIASVAAVEARIEATIEEMQRQIQQHKAPQPSETSFAASAADTQQSFGMHTNGNHSDTIALVVELREELENFGDLPRLIIKVRTSVEMLHILHLIL